MKNSEPIKVSEETTAKCNAPNQFERFDRLCRVVVAVPKSAVDAEEAKWKRKRRKAKR
jgi:hypothetical protein